MKLLTFELDPDSLADEIKSIFISLVTFSDERLATDLSTMSNHQYIDSF